MMTTPESAQAVQAVLALPFLLMGISHIVQPKMWTDFFTYLHGLGTTGVVFRTFALELIPAAVIVAFHSVWSGPETVISVYGVLLGLKIAISLLAPSVGLRSLALAQRNHNVSFIGAGVFLIALSAICFWSMFNQESLPG